MKRFWLLMLIVLTVVFTGWFAQAQQWTTANQATIAWNATTTLENGDPLPEGAIIKYYVYLKKSGEAGDGERKGITEGLQYTITFTEEGKYIVGVSAARYEGDQLVQESTINWSDTNGESTPNPFGFTYFDRPAPPLQFRIQ